MCETSITRCMGSVTSEQSVAPAPQIGYTTVFFWEYFGPLVTYAVFYYFPHVFYPSYKCARLAGGLRTCPPRTVCGHLLLDA